MSDVEPRNSEPLWLRDKPMPSDRPAVMAIVNRTPDSFYDQGATFDDEPARAAVRRAVDEGADLVDIGGVKAGPGENVDVTEEIRRVLPFVAWVRAEFPELAISVDTWRHEVGEAVCREGADLLNDTWAGADPRLAEIAAEFGTGYVCSHTGSAIPRTRPHRRAYDDVVTDIVTAVTEHARRIVEVGVPKAGVLIDPAHDFGKNTWHSLEVSRRLDELVDTGWPVLVSLSNKDFVGEALGRGVGERLMGTLAVTAVSAWQGARMFRAHNVAQTRDVVDMVAVLRGERNPARTVRGLA